MSSSKSFGKDPAPSAIRYLVLLSALTSGIIALSFLPKMAGASTSELDFYQNAVPIFGFFSLLSVVEWFLLGRSRNLKGPYGFAFASEVFKTIGLSIGTQSYVQNVDGASSGDFSLLFFANIGIIVMLGLTKFLRSRIEEYAKRDISRHALNLLPTILVLLLFLGTYVTEIAGLGTPRQRQNFDPYTDKDIDWSMFNSPTWDATYLLENLLDQFTAGLSTPDTPLFNVTNTHPDAENGQDPPTYWRLSNLATYEYTNKPPYSTDWNPSDQSKIILSAIPTTPNSTYSNIIPSNEQTASYTVEMPLDYNSTTSDVSVHPNFINMLPTTWNGKDGSYISSNSFNLYSSERESSLTPVTNQAKEVFPTTIGTIGLNGIYADLQTAETSTDAGVFEYTMEYKAPDIQTAAAFSLGRDDSVYEGILSANTWSDLRTLYLQVPTEVPGGLDYETWAPNVAGNATSWNDSFQTVFGQAYANMLKFENFTFDESMWISNQLAPGVEMDRPAEYEDYNEWFMKRGSGVSLHFASTYAIINRLQKIPTRVVIGYIAGNDSIEFAPKRMISSRFLHAWAEVLVPIDPNPILPGDEYVEWMSFDPLLSYLADQYGFELPSDIIPSSSAEQTSFIRPDYDLEGKGILLATIEHAAQPNDWIFERATINYSGLTPSPYTLHDGDHVNLSTRLIAVPSAATWLPYQDTNISFYVGTLDENTTLYGIETNGTPVGSVLTDSRGVATISFDIDVVKFGIRQVNFYAVVHLGTSGEVRRASISLSYFITF